MSDLDKAIRAVLGAMNDDSHRRDCGCALWPNDCDNALHLPVEKDRWLADVGFTLETAVRLGWQPPAGSGVSSPDTPPAPRPARVWREGDPVGDLLNPVIRVARLVVTEEFAATSFVQRKLDLGWRLAENCLLLLETWGVVDPTSGSKARRVRGVPMSELDDLIAALTASSEVVVPTDTDGRDQ